MNTSHTSPNPSARTLPTVEEVEAYAPELFALADAYAEVTLEGKIDFDLEIFDAVDAALAGAAEAQVLAVISPEHPGAAQAAALLRRLVQRRRPNN